MINKCPVCGKSAMSISVKLFSSRNNKVCMECGETLKSSVWERIVEITTVLIALFFGMFSPHPLNLGWIVAMLITVMLYVITEIALPLEKRN